jgi:hypothetical protein
MIMRVMRLAAVAFTAVILTVLTCATLVLAQIVPIVPGNYAITWLRHSFPDSYVDPYAEPVIDGGMSTFRLEDTTDPTAIGLGLCPPAPFVLVSPPTTGAQVWCFYADGRLDQTNFGGGRGRNTPPRSRSSMSLRAFTGVGQLRASTGSPCSCRRRHRRPPPSRSSSRSRKRRRP